ncbi:MAG: PEP-CTERM sorting domain-containing protein [Microcystaceae cyanobacterium]
MEPAETPSTPEPSTLLGLLVIGGAGLLTKRQKQN